MVSCIVPIYNAENTLVETISSICNQTYRDIEIICVDDESEDDSLYILKEILRNDERIKVFELLHCGAAACRNFGLGKAKGKYVVFFDADDRFDADLLENAVKEAELSGADLVVWGCRVFNVDGNNKIFDYENTCGTNRVIAHSDLTYEDFMAAEDVPWNKLCKRETVVKNDIHFQDLPSNNDILFSRSMVICANKISFLGKSYVDYFRGNSAGLSQKRDCGIVYWYEAHSAVVERLNEAMEDDAILCKYLENVYEQIRIVFRNNNDAMKDRIMNAAMNNPGLLLEYEKRIKPISMNKKRFIKLLLQGDVRLFEMRPFLLEIAELQDRKEISTGDKKRVLWGCGIRGKRFLEACAFYNFRIDYLVDASEKMRGTVYDGFEIQTYDDIEDKADIVIVSSQKIYDEIAGRITDKILINLSDFSC